MLASATLTKPPEHIAQLLTHLSPEAELPAITADNLEPLLALADKYQIKVIFTRSMRELTDPKLQQLQSETLYTLYTTALQAKRVALTNVSCYGHMAATIFPAEQ
eukprot:jgi/Chlat1/7647/Chrsp64S07167